MQAFPVTVTPDRPSLLPSETALQVSYDGGKSWYDRGKFTGITGGMLTRLVALERKARLRAAVSETNSHAPSISDSWGVWVRAWVSTPKARTTMSPSRYYTVYGYLKPRHAVGSEPVEIRCFKKNSSGDYKFHHSVSAKVSDYSTYSKYKASVKLHHRGKWSLRAYAPADSRHMGKSSRYYRYVTVR
jgi:hypothetical protein